jgi:hypothetical protein
VLLSSFFLAIPDGGEFKLGCFGFHGYSRFFMANTGKMEWKIEEKGSAFHKESALKGPLAL